MADRDVRWIGIGIRPERVFVSSLPAETIRFAIAVAVVILGVAVGLIGLGVLAISGRPLLVTTGGRIVRSADELLLGRGPRSFLYLIADGSGAVKIGRSDDPPHRLGALQTGHPDQLILLHTIRCRHARHAAAIEGELHRYFAERRLAGEWFDLDRRDLRRARQLARRWR